MHLLSTCYFKKIFYYRALTHFLAYSRLPCIFYIRCVVAGTPGIEDWILDVLWMLWSCRLCLDAFILLIHTSIVVSSCRACRPRILVISILSQTVVLLMSVLIHSVYLDCCIEIFKLGSLFQLHLIQLWCYLSIMHCCGTDYIKLFVMVKWDCIKLKFESF